MNVFYKSMLAAAIVVSVASAEAAHRHAALAGGRLAAQEFSAGAFLAAVPAEPFAGLHDLTDAAARDAAATARVTLAVSGDLAAVPAAAAAKVLDAAASRDTAREAAPAASAAAIGSMAANQSARAAEARIAPVATGATEIAAVHVAAAAA